MILDQQLTGHLIVHSALHEDSLHLGSKKEIRNDFSLKLIHKYLA